MLDEEGTPADVVWVYARTGEDEKGRVQMSTFLVEAGMPGYSVGQKIMDKTGMRASNTAELVFQTALCRLRTSSVMRAAPCST